MAKQAINFEISKIANGGGTGQIGPGPQTSR